jgi:hypothetical protein
MFEAPQGVLPVNSVRSRRIRCNTDRPAWPSAPIGMTSAITNPLHVEEMIGVMGGDVLMGQDAHCAAWIRKFREPAPEGEAAAGGRRGRENRRRGGGGGGNSGAEGVQAAASQESQTGAAEVVNG